MTTPPPTDTDYLTVPEAAHTTRVSTKTIQRAINARQLRSKTTGRGGRRLIRRTWLHEWIESLPDSADRPGRATT